MNEMLCKIKYNKTTDCMELWFTDHKNGEWLMEVEYPFTQRAGEDAGADPEYLHFSIIRRLQKMADMGYRFIHK